MKISIVGTGYVGLVAGAVFAEGGLYVSCFDKNTNKINQLQNGEAPIYEPGLAPIIDRNVKADRLRFTSIINHAITASDIIVLAVGTPARNSDGYADLSAFYDAVRDIAPWLPPRQYERVEDIPAKNGIADQYNLSLIASSLAASSKTAGSSVKEFKARGEVLENKHVKCADMDPVNKRAVPEQCIVGSDVSISASEKKTLIVVKSTVPVGTCDEIERLLLQIRPDINISVVSNPEFLREGTAVQDFMNPDRIIIGTEDAFAQKLMAILYQPIINGTDKAIFTKRSTAELIKYASNAFLVTKLTFINEIADLCETVGTDINDVAKGMGLDERIGPHFLQAGPGYGGSCFPKDTRALVKTAHDAGKTLRLVEAAIAVNEQRKNFMARKVIDACGGSVRNKRLAVLGLTFKANTDDVRESPALSIIQLLQDNGAIITAFDPAGMDGAKAVVDNIVYATDPYGCVRGANAVVVMTEWPIFRSLDLRNIKSLLSEPIVVDLRNVFSASDAVKAGLVYHSVGRDVSYPCKVEHSQKEAMLIV